MAFGEARFFQPPCLVDPPPALDRRTLFYFRCPSDDMFVGRHIEQFPRLVGIVEHQVSVPGIGGDIGDVVFVAAEIAPGGKILVQHVELALRFYRIAVEGVLILGVEMAEVSAEIGRRAHLPKQSR